MGMYLLLMAACPDTAFSQISGYKINLGGSYQMDPRRISVNGPAPAIIVGSSSTWQHQLEWRSFHLNLQDQGEQDSTGVFLDGEISHQVDIAWRYQFTRLFGPIHWKIRPMLGASVNQSLTYGRVNPFVSTQFFRESIRSRTSLGLATGGRIKVKGNLLLDMEYLLEFLEFSAGRDQINNPNLPVRQQTSLWANFWLGIYQHQTRVGLVVLL